LDQQSLYGSDEVPRSKLVLAPRFDLRLGLKLEPATGPVEVTVIELVKRPTPD
jgi:uncharacterized protein (TIGR03435 family)